MKSNDTSHNYNQFAEWLVRRVTERAKGADEDSRRIYDVQPAEHILTGFLTPVKKAAHAAAKSSGAVGRAKDEDADAVPDLPQDEAYEQTAMGLEWCGERGQIVAGRALTVTVSFRAYLRRLPTRSEQLQGITWKSERRRPSAPPLTPPPEKYADVRPVWACEQIEPAGIRLDLADVLKRKRYACPLRWQIIPGSGRADVADLHPTHHPLKVRESDLQTEQSWQRWRDAHRADRPPVEWEPWLDVRVIESRAEPEVVRFALRVINRTATGAGDYTDPNLYGVEIGVTVPSETWRHTEFNELPDSFRYDRRMPAVGINTHVTAARRGEVIELRTDSVPIQKTHRLEPLGVPSAEPTFAGLADDPLPVLRAILDEMRRYDRETWQGKLDSLGGTDEGREALVAREEFRREAERFARGVAILGDGRYPQVVEAFRLMNRAMLKQQEIEERKSGVSRYDQWRLFQIVFIVSQLPDLAARQHPELATGEEETVEVLWFAAGGGKTEAFLGLMVWQAFFDRLRGKKFGTTAFVRFPLRLLAFQQLQRLGRALAAAELVRQERKLGGARFSIGYFVGGTLTPNKIEDNDHRRFQSHVDAHLQLFHSCPFCAEPVKLGYEPQLRLVQHLCASAACPGGGERLPVYVVDWDVYRYLPTVVVSTVDKLAQLGQNQRFANLFGRFDLLCRRHGASFQGINGRDNFCAAAKRFGDLRGEYRDASGADRRPSHCGQDRVLYEFHDPAPALLIQDELHLLSEELGTFDSHYETAAMEMMRAFGSGKAWKVIAATATIKEFENHARHLYLQPARQFPAPGPEAYESFYYTQDRGRTGRIFVGLLGVGRKHTAAVTRTLSLVYLELEQARALIDRDPAAACRRYGLGPTGLPELRRLLFDYELALTYVLTRKGSDQVAEAIETRVKKDLDEMAQTAHELVVNTFNGSADPAEMKRTLEEIGRESAEGDPSARVRGIVATNVIGHGVDVDRFNVIAFAGFTRNVSEYIQASARVGRRHPGISILVATPQSERDRSIFDRFAKFHEYLDRLIDASAINRWPEAALRKTLPGVLSGYLMGVAAHRLKRPLAVEADVQRSYGSPGAEALNEEAVVEWVGRAYGQEFADAAERFRDELYKQTRLAYNQIDKTRPQPGRSETINARLKAMRSLRDVDAPAEISVSSDTDNEIIRRLTSG
jgi:hypothetical protein